MLFKKPFGCSWGQQGPQPLQNVPPRGGTKLTFFAPKWGLLGALGGSLGQLCPRGPKNHPRATQDAPRKSCPRGAQESTPRLLPDLDFEPFWGRFGRILGSFWIGFCKDFQTHGSIFSQLSAGSAGGLRPHQTPPALLRGAPGGGNAALRR